MQNVLRSVFKKVFGMGASSQKNANWTVWWGETVCQDSPKYRRKNRFKHMAGGTERWSSRDNSLGRGIIIEQIKINQRESNFTLLF